MGLSSKHLKADNHRPVSETPFKWRFVDGPIVARHSVLAGLTLFNSMYTKNDKMISFSCDEVKCGSDAFVSM